MSYITKSVSPSTNHLYLTFKIRKMKDTMRKIATWKMTWKLHQSSVTIDFNSYLKDLKESSETDGLQKVIRNF